MTYLAVFIGGGLGSILRFSLSRFNGSVDSLWYGLGTFTANMLSCFILGVVFAIQGKIGFDENVKLLLLTGFCGGFSTFSTFSFELLNYIQKGSYLLAFLYLSVSVVVSLAMIILGVKIVS